MPTTAPAPTSTAFVPGVCRTLRAQVSEQTFSWPCCAFPAEQKLPLTQVDLEKEGPSLVTGLAQGGRPSLACAVPNVHRQEPATLHFWENFALEHRSGAQSASTR